MTRTSQINEIGDRKRHHVMAGGCPTDLLGAQTDDDGERVTNQTHWYDGYNHPEVHIHCHYESVYYIPLPIWQLGAAAAAAVLRCHHHCMARQL